MPAPPAPTTTMSAVSVTSSAAPALAVTLAKSLAFRPDFSRAALAASNTALDVMVAPDTVSTVIVLPATISVGSFSNALSPMPTVSFGPSALTSVMTFFSMVNVTVTSPPLPFAVPANVPDTDFAEHPGIAPRIAATPNNPATATFEITFFFIYCFLSSLTAYPLCLKIAFETRMLFFLFLSQVHFGVP